MASPATQTKNAIAAITNRANLVIPTIDFTQHQLENGEVVSTTERVVKDVSPRFWSSWLVKAKKVGAVWIDRVRSAILQQLVLPA